MADLSLSSQTTISRATAWRPYTASILADPDPSVVGILLPDAPDDIEDDFEPFAQAALAQELNVIMKVVEAGHLPPSYIPEAYFGMRHVDVVRQSAKDHARLRENGMLVGNERWDPTQTTTATATSIMSEAEAEEAAEREIVDKSALLNG